MGKCCGSLPLYELDAGKFQQQFYFKLNLCVCACVCVICSPLFDIQSHSLVAENELSNDRISS